MKPISQQASAAARRICGACGSDEESHIASAAKAIDEEFYFVFKANRKMLSALQKISKLRDGEVRLFEGGCQRLAEKALK